MIEGLVVLAALIAIVWFMAKDVVSFRSTGSIGKPSDGSGRLSSLLVGLATVTALAGLMERGVLGLDGLTMVTVGIGIVSGLMGAFPALGPMGSWGMSAIGLIAAVPAIATLATGGSACGTTAPVIGVIASGALLMIIYVLTAVATAFVGGGVRPGFGVALFGGTEVIAFMNSPLGVDLIGNAPLAFIAAMLGAVLLGWAVVRLSELVMALFAAVILMSTLGTQQLGVYCGPGLDYGGVFGTFIGFAVGYVVITVLMGLVGRRS